MTGNVSHRFDRLPPTGAERTVDGRPTREAVLDFWSDRFGVPPDTFADHTFWVKGRDSVWAVSGTEPEPVAIEALGLRFLRTGGRHWKPTTNAVQRFGAAATRNVIDLDRESARRFVRGDDQAVEWAGDWGYLVVSTEVAGDQTPLGVGLYTHGELTSVVPKARQVDLD